MSYQPVIIIGAGRSGTNILRDTLTKLDDWHTWDCDEINLIWRHGNLQLSSDVMDKSHARPEVCHYIRKAFERLYRASGGDVILEKTCANSMRVPFIDAIFPEARYIYIVRDGRDVALSAAKRWTASIEWPYLLKKLRYVPLSDIPLHGLKFARNRVAQLLSSEKRQPVWGPVFPEMRDWAKTRPLIDVCAKQWASCVAESDSAFAQMPQRKWIKVRYEELVSEPSAVMGAILDWYYDGGKTESISESALSAIHSGSLYGWKQKRGLFTADALNIMSVQLERHGYEAAI